MNIPILKTDRITLRPFTDADTDALTAILNGEDVLRYFPSSNPPPRDGVQHLINRMNKHWDDYGYGLWAMESNTGQLMGRCGLQYIETTDEIEIDYILGRQFWGKGFATEAATVSLKYGFDNLNCKTIIGLIHTDNIASQKVLTKIGMQYIETTEYFNMTVKKYAKEKT